MTKNELLEQAALILEQEGWLICRYARETGSGRMRDFADRYKEWQVTVDKFRKEVPDLWPIPPDNS